MQGTTRHNLLPTNTFQRKGGLGVAEAVEGLRGVDGVSVVTFDPFIAGSVFRQVAVAA
jgi:hypothetical protein